MNRITIMFILALLTATTAKGEGLDSLQMLVQRGDSCMQQYNTFEALKHYQQAFDATSKQGDSTFSTLYSAGMCYTKTDSLERAYQCLKPTIFSSSTLLARKKTPRNNSCR